MQTEPTTYELELRQEKMELFASLQLGDRQHRREITVNIIERDRKEATSYKLLIEDLRRKDPDGVKWHYQGLLMPHGGRWVPVQGFVQPDRRQGNITTQVTVICSRCEYSRVVSYREKFCKLCGQQLTITESHTIF